MNKSKSIVILGMHRSGTSALTGILQQAGLYLGDISVENTDNLKGNRESTHIMRLHEDVLRRNSGSWDNPPDKMHWDAIHYSMQDLIIRQFQSEPIWGFKDPRTILMLGPWRKALPHASLVGIYRHPSLVSSSLHTRNGMDFTTALELWIKYNRTLLWHRRNTKNFSLLEFSIQPSVFYDNVSSLINSLGLSQEGLSFYDSSLQNQETIDLSDLQPYRTAVGLYEKLNNEVGIASELLKSHTIER